MEPSTNFINPATLVILGIILLLMIIFTLYKLVSNISFLRSRHRDQIKRVKHLKLRRMLEHLNIPFKQYLKKTSELDKERHIWACQNCPNPKECNQLLDGEQVEMDIEEICPNNYRLKNLSKPTTD